MSPVRAIAKALIAALLFTSCAYAEALKSPAPQHSSPEELDQMLAPVALFPDPLLAQILMASTYPLEITEAAHWLQDKTNTARDRDHLVNALDLTHWEPSVKALVPFGTVLRMMDDHLDWTERLGNAFLADQAAVLDSVQRLRHLAQGAGHLQTTAQESVTVNDQVILLAAPAFGTFYVPVYDPTAIYGKWPNANFPPDSFAEIMPAKTAGSLPGWREVALAPSLRDWNRVDWDRHKIYVDPDRFAALNDNRLAPGNSVWQNDPAHRADVASAAPELRERLTKAAHSQDGDDYEADWNAQIHPAAQHQERARGAPSWRDTVPFDGAPAATAQPDDVSAAAQVDPNQQFGDYAGAAAPQMSSDGVSAAPASNSPWQNRDREPAFGQKNGHRADHRTQEEYHHEIGEPSADPARIHQSGANVAGRPALSTPGPAHIPSAHFVQNRGSNRPNHFGWRMPGFAPRQAGSRIAHFAGGRGHR